MLAYVQVPVCDVCDFRGAVSSGDVPGSTMNEKLKRLLAVKRAQDSGIPPEAVRLLSVLETELVRLTAAADRIGADLESVAGDLDRAIEMFRAASQ